MKSSRVRMLAALVLILAVSFFPGCPFGPDDDKETPPAVEYKPLTDKENVLYNLIKSYNQANIEEYVKLLHDDYIWYNQAQDVTQHGLPEFCTRAEDIDMTTGIFQAKLGTHPDPDKHLSRLELKFYGTTWVSITELGGTPCEDCWEATREYYLTLILKNGAMTYIANDLVKFTVVPVTVGDKKLYKLRRADDLPRP